ncbi:hypothetical protein GCM10027614_66910 [Micromonospora vulcania]
MTGTAGAQLATTAVAGPAEADWAAAEALVRALPPTARVLLICHVNPDGDALGSMLGFGLGLRQLGVRRLQATFPGPPEVPSRSVGCPAWTYWFRRALRIPTRTW